MDAEGGLAFLGGAIVGTALTWEGAVLLIVAVFDLALKDRRDPWQGRLHPQSDAFLKGLSGPPEVDLMVRVALEPEELSDEPQGEGLPRRNFKGGLGAARPLDLLEYGQPGPRHQVVRERGDRELAAGQPKAGDPGVVLRQEEGLGPKPDAVAQGGKPLPAVRGPTTR
jgi:hypothetical protein